MPRGGCQVEIIVALCHLVGVEHKHFRGFHMFLPPGIDRVLLPLLEAGNVPVPVELIGHGFVIFPDAGLHFREELLLKVTGMGRCGLKIGIFVPQVLQHLPIFPITEPVVVIGADIAVLFKDVGVPPGNRWLGVLHGMVLGVAGKCKNTT